MSESELDDLMGEVGGPCNVMGMINMFQEKMAGTVTTPTSLSCRPSWLTTRAARWTSRCSSTPFSTWGDKMTKAEIDDVFNEFEIDEDFMVKTKEVVGLFVAVKE